MIIFLAEMILCLIIMIINKGCFVRGFKGLISKTPNNDTLVSIGVILSFVYSFYSVLTNREVFFFATAVILTVISLGNLIIEKMHYKGREAGMGLLKLIPENATVLDKYGKERSIPTKDIKVGDIFVVRPGESIPVDAVIVEGNSRIDLKALTGDKEPVDKHIGGKVLAGSLNVSGFIKCRALSTLDETTISKILKILKAMHNEKSSLESKTSKISAMLSTLVIIISIITFAVWLYLSKDIGLALGRAIAVLFIASPGAFFLSAFMGMRTGIGISLSRGILFKSTSGFERTGMSQIVALDKTGTITKGEPVVSDVFTPDSITRSGYSLINNSENELLKIAGLLEQKSSHPLAKAVVDYVGDVNNYVDEIDYDNEEEITDFEVLPGRGLKGKYKGHDVIGASLKYISDLVPILPEVREKAEGLASQGKTPLCFVLDRKLLGIIAISDAVKEEAAEAVKELKNLKLHVVMLTGDNERTAASIGDRIGVSEISSEILPEGKMRIIKKLSENGRVLMVGDPGSENEALLCADTSIAINSSDNVNVDGDVILLNSSLLDVPKAVKCSRFTRSIIKQNLLFSCIYNLFCIPLAAGVFISFGLTITPVFSAVIMILFSLMIAINILFIPIRG